MGKPASIDDYIENSSEFARPLLERLHTIIRRSAPQLEQVIRWGSPSYKGRNLVCGMAGFTRHVTLFFWRGAELGDQSGQLVHGQGRTTARSAKFHSPGEIDARAVRNWVLAAVALDGDDDKPKARVKRRPELPVPPVLAAALAKNAKARRTFESLPPSHRREYSEWISEAKQEATVARRVAKALEKLSAGEGLNDKYRR
jgi:uncharacterized protein YdeI (YjbR/CyaY-like superfamily)